MQHAICEVNRNQSDHIIAVEVKVQYLPLNQSEVRVKRGKKYSGKVPQNCKSTVLHKNVISYIQLLHSTH